MDLSLNGKRALVTGSTAGIGYATAFELARLGAEVIVNGRSDDSVAAAVDTLSERYPGTRFHAAAMDLSNAAGAEQLIKAFPEVDVLVNSLGIFEPKPFLEIADEDWERFFQTNVMSGVRLARHYLPAMLDADWGRIVFVSSESGIHIPSEMVHYGVTKTAQLGVSRGIAELTAGTAVTCNAVLPGPTWSRGVAGFVRQMAGERDVDTETMEREFFDTARPTSLLRRFAQPEEVAHLIAYVCSPASSATNGAALRVDGGVVRTIV